MFNHRKLTTICCAVVLAFGLAACGGSSDTAMDTTDPVVEPDPALGAAQMAAMTAATEADAAADAAEAAADAQIASMAADEASYALARNAAVRARAASDAAAEANTAAQAATTTIAAQAKQAEAEAAQKTAEAEQANADMYAGKVRTAQQAIDDEAQRVIDVASALEAAMASYVAAADDATDAETAAAEAEEAAPGSPGATAAREAAAAARIAADAAKAAHDAITADMTKAEADAKAVAAASAADTANTEYMTAKAENDDIQTQVVTGNEQQRRQDVADAREYGGKAVEAAKTAAEDAADAADAAEMAAADADAAHTMAKNARTDSAAAKTAADNANAAYMKAKTAAGNANAAYMAAKTAIAGVMDDSSSEDAKAARSTAESQQGMAEAGQTTAEAEQGKAEMAETSAMTAAGTHVLELLKAANDTDPQTDVDARKGTVKLMAEAIETAAKSNDNGSGGTTAVVTWTADTPAKPDATPPTEVKPGAFKINLKPNQQGVLGFRTKAGEKPKTATEIDGLPGFMHGYEISDNKAHAIVFTDKMQGSPAVTSVVFISAKELTNDSVKGNNVTDLGTKSGTGYTGVTYYEGAVNKDTDTDTAFMGSLNCADGKDCSVETDNNGKITVSGYTFTGNRAERKAVEAASRMENNDYLAFGVWLDNSKVEKPNFGAFAGGGEPVSENKYSNLLTGTAKYTGSATGVYTAGESVDYFQGDATLTADFGKVDTEEDGKDSDPGTITGMIDDIVAGGNAMSDVIRLSSSKIEKHGTFRGNARMGAGMIQDDDSVKYPYNGSWSGQFYGPATDDAATKNVEEGPENTAPGAAAGTFGVTGMMGEGDDAVTRSYVGAFGARR